MCVDSQELDFANMCLPCRQCLEADGSFPWAALSVWGFEDAPVSWRTNEHGWHFSGDNNYTVVLFRTGQFWHLTSLASHDVL